MQLTKLDIKGFKSFGDKVQINFGEGITGIVGPNGCGKSNIVDAIRWVLGEQKISQLRSEKLENIVFNGTKKRKATQMAEVSLSFKNTKNLLPVEYNDVTITRRFYRSGESEYLLNGVNCRLKDITNLFLDTGIASNSYAIIELGMVDDILNDKENSRRHLFEEAAGISKFKIRKRETLKKLKDTDDDLDRVEDLLFEIEKNMRSLERQARQARRYYKIKEDYKVYSVELAKKSVRKKQESLDDINKQIQSEHDLKLSLSGQIAEGDAELEKSKSDLIKREKLLAGRQKTLNEHVARIRNYESDKKIKHERLNFLNDKSQSIKDQIEQDKQSLDRANFSIKSLSQEKESAHKQLDEIELTKDTLEKDLEEQKVKTSSLQNEYAGLDEAYRKQKDALYNISKDLEIKEIQLTSYKSELEKATTDSSEKTANLVEFENKLKHLNKELSAKQSELELLEKGEVQLQNMIESVEKTIEVMREEKQQVGRKLDARQNEYNLTKSLVDNLEGFPEAIKFLKKKARWNKNAPLLSDIISTHEKYRITIENYLEPYMNYYVVEDEDEAFKAINLLSDAAKGKAHFFILNKFGEFHSRDPKIFDNAIPATEIVEYENKYKHLVAHILDGVYIVSGPESNIPEDRENVFITENGKVTKRKYSISGGSVGLFEGKRIGRAKNLEKLQVTVKKYQAKLDEIEENYRERQHELDQLKSQTRKISIENLQSQINLLQQELVSFETKQEQMAGLLSSNTVRKEDIAERIHELNIERAELAPKAEKMQVELELQQEKLRSLNAELSSFKEQLEEKSGKFNEENIFFHQKQNRLASLEQEISFKESARGGAAQRIEKNSRDLQRNEEEIKKLLESNEIREDELISLYKEKETIEQGVNEAEKEYYATRGFIDDIEKRVRGIHLKKENIDTLLLELQNKANELKLSMSSVKERLAVEFEVDLLAVSGNEIDHEAVTLSEEELSEKVAKFKEVLDKIGPVNPMAMEAYDEIKERHDFITGQKTDLEKAKESLLTTIEEIDLVAKETFLQAFKKIKDNFVTVFRSLFTEEDDCDLRLLNAENPLESSIEIIAKPKGKKPLTISQLSGGEKTLTATSLLFSIYLLKPAPFCIFDEVDAPLDDANIDKFNKIIRKFSEESQFIIVTHNKRTMASTDVIYGITMIEQGVSRVVPADLRALD
ncbi:MAG: chromosome segregation protein SMC [Cytophagales bacterium]|nr:chromosome segregation protein SMC [Cytophagales bacterium]